MKWSYKIGEFRGIGVYLHFTFLLLVGLIALWTLNAQSSLVAAVEVVLFLLALFTCVVLHEFGHALTAQKYGIPTRDITLLPIGGVARLERMPENPRQELWVALAGPAVNVVIAAGLLALLTLTGSWTPLAQFTLSGGSLLQQIAIVNITLVVFNMLPAFPMDGGRVLRALLAMQTDYTRATLTAGRIGQAMAVLFGIFGLFSNPMLILIAVFVWTGAQQEMLATRARSASSWKPFPAVAGHARDLPLNADMVAWPAQMSLPITGKEAAEVQARLMSITDPWLRQLALRSYYLGRRHAGRPSSPAAWRSEETDSSGGRRS